MSTILDLVAQRLTGMDARIRAADEALATERDERATAAATQGAAIQALQLLTLQIREELDLRRRLHDEQAARINALVAQLTELGVSPNA